MTDRAIVSNATALHARLRTFAKRNVPAKHPSYAAANVAKRMKNAKTAFVSGVLFQVVPKTKKNAVTCVANPMKFVQTANVFPIHVRKMKVIFGVSKTKFAVNPVKDAKTAHA